MEREAWKEPEWVWRTGCLLNSYRHWTGRELLDRDGSPLDQAERLYRAPFVVLAHGNEANPILNLGNRTALDLWEMDLETFLTTPSRQTAEPDHREARSDLLARVERDGFIDDYSGIRISATGRRFQIDRATVWNLIDEAGERVGQAATFSSWRFLDSEGR